MKEITIEDVLKLGTDIPTELLKFGDAILTEEKKNPNHITTQLNRDEIISYNTGYHKGFLRGHQTASLNRQGWTRVEDGLPDKYGKEVLAYSNGEYLIGTLYNHYGRNICEGADTMIEDVTHWMPLPNKPEPI